MNCDAWGMFFTITHWGSCLAQVCICIAVTDGSVVWLTLRLSVCVCVCVCVCPMCVCVFVCALCTQLVYSIHSLATQSSKFHLPHLLLDINSVWFVSQFTCACSPLGRLDCCSDCCPLWPPEPSARAVQDLWGRLPAQDEGEGHAGCKWQWKVEWIVHVHNHHAWLHSQDDCQQAIVHEVTVSAGVCV